VFKVKERQISMTPEGKRVIKLVKSISRKHDLTNDITSEPVLAPNTFKIELPATSFVDRVSK
jgi:hypothetical protein